MAVPEPITRIDDIEQGHLALLVELIGACSSTVLTERVLRETCGDLTPAQFEALAFLHRHGGCSSKALSEGLRISIPSSTRLVDRLERKGLVDRRESGVDRRLVTLTATTEGVKAIHAVREARTARLQEALLSFAPDERKSLLLLLKRFLLAVMRDEQTVEDCCRHCGPEHDSDCIVNAAHIALVGRPVEHP